MTSPTNRRAHPAQRARTVATIVTSGFAVALVAAMGVSRHSASAGPAPSAGEGQSAADDAQAGLAPPAFQGGAVPGYAGSTAHSRSHGS